MIVIVIVMAAEKAVAAAMRIAASDLVMVGGGQMGGRLDSGFGGWVDGWYRSAMCVEISMDSINQLFEFRWLPYDCASSRRFNAIHL